MAEKSVIEVIAEAICQTLKSTGKFTTGYAYASARAGARPTFNVWWLGFSDSGPEARAARQPTITTFRYIAELRVDLKADAEGCQQQLMRLVQASREAILSNNRLGPTPGVLRSHIVSGSQDIDAGGDDNPQLVAQLVIEVDYAGAWTAPD